MKISPELPKMHIEQSNPAWNTFFSSFETMPTEKEKQMIIQNFIDFSRRHLNHVFDHMIKRMKEIRKN